MNQVKQPKFIIFGAPLICKEEIDEVVATMESGWLGTGPKVKIFEENFRQYIGAPFALAVNSCTAALHLSLIALDLKPGDEVITTPMTFCATVNSIIHAGATPVLADVDLDTMNIDPKEIEKKINKNTKAILPVHFAGRPCQMDSIVSLSEKHGLSIIEDCAHAIESNYKGKRVGTFGRFGCYSFYVTKNIVTGEGGMVLATNEKDAKRVKVLSLHGMSADAWSRYSDSGYKHYEVVECGYKYNMMDLQASIGIHQLSRIEKNWDRRAEIWSRYNDGFANLPIGLPAKVEVNTKHAYHLYTILIDNKKVSITRDEFLVKMKDKGIGVGVHYLSIPEHEYYRKNFGWKLEDYPNAVKIGRETISLPLTPKLSDTEVDYIIQSVKEILEDHKY